MSLLLAISLIICAGMLGMLAGYILSIYQQRD